MKIYPGQSWDGIAYGKVQVASKSLGRLVNKHKKVFIYVLDDDEDVPEQFKITANKGVVITKHCKICDNRYTFKTIESILTTCPGCGSVL